MNIINKKLNILFVSLFSVFIMNLQAATLIYELNNEFSGGTEPTGPKPWATATFDDSFGGSNTVRLTMSATNLSGSEFISQWYFNYDPSLDPTKLSFNFVSGGVNDSNVNKLTGTNAFKADGDGKYDILFDFPPPPGQFSQKFTAGESVIYDITRTDGALFASSFDFLSNPDGGHGPFHTAAHVQGIGANGDDSGWISEGDGNGNGEVPIPEPTTFLILGSMAAGVGALKKKRKNL